MNDDILEFLTKINPEIVRVIYLFDDLCRHVINSKSNFLNEMKQMKQMKHDCFYLNKNGYFSLACIYKNTNKNFFILYLEIFIIDITKVTMQK